jgi:hypothetical protein
MSIVLALHDAEKNCRSQDARVTLTLRSGVQIYGKLKPHNSPLEPDGTVMLETAKQGWTTVEIREIVAVGVSR